MYYQFQNRLTQTVHAFLRERYQVDLTNIVVEQPPRVELGEYALPLSFELAKRLRQPPRKIAQEIVDSIGRIPGFDKLEVAGAGYINARVRRSDFAAALTRHEAALPPVAEIAQRLRQKMLVEHTSINPNKAAHIGHLRNAVLGDTFVRLLREAGYPVDIQNYIDNTGVQVADVVVGWVHLEKKSKDDIAALIATDPRFDYTCWDLYARVSQWYAEDKRNEQVRLDTLHQVEAGGNDVAAIAAMISADIVRRHLDTMWRLGIQYDFLPQESEILHLHFWETAFQQLKDKGVVKYVEEGKNQGCWVMERAKAEERTAEDTEGTEEDQKVLVRSNGTVTYVGKDIAYHLWKFGLLGQDFGYRRFYTYPDGHECWISTSPEQDEPGHPHFGGVAAIYNVIDTRQSDPQNQVREAIRQLGFEEQAGRYTHFSYEMVALTPRTAAQLGYELDEQDRGRPYVEVSGRRGLGVKADDLIDALIAAAQREVDSRHPDRSPEERHQIAGQIAIGALRYFMLKFTKNSVIAFDFEEALSFEGETGPYCQYAVVRATNIFRKAEVEPEAALDEEVDFAAFLSGDGGDEIWELWLAASKLQNVIEQCIATAEPAYLAKYTFQLAQLWNNFYHRHRIIAEADDARRQFLFSTAAVVRRELIRALETMGIEVPVVM